MAAISGKRRMGDGYEPHVDDVDGRLIYSLPVDSGHVSLSFEYEIEAGDLAVLLNDIYRRAVLHWVLHTKLQRTIIGTAEKISQADFRALLSEILHSPIDNVEQLIQAVNREHNIHLQYYIGLDLAQAR
ncbi:MULTISPECIES: hypothetical protein [Rhizobium]|uniref:Uncharacterized protein n=1 Tax=Rhizobium leguminosarum bv. viciae TaxID=387 RepID=A0A8G2IUL9_RHILV|nr:hypothetical protein [Rhizobium leguminosarum]MBY5421715.1 hypothetical protein [Rhizobium leguminosarum]NKK11128.1 hypothetical protein [Rhizobium leguminosarum bv. viciae]NKK24954.1 hypothetical protein [Rhizobium leguminosarum bv. viciae]TBX88941.1 hypothetical protein E0H31_25000 [Rhizobium leguminosarum bv. viciae]TBZ14094.1 hypothetical protein E0H52_25820 [Rhizobium leguminosarum bv. viciae]